MHSERIQLLIINESILTSYRLKPSTRLFDGFFVNVPETLHLSRELRVEEHDTLPLSGVPELKSVPEPYYS